MHSVGLVWITGRTKTKGSSNVREPEDRVNVKHLMNELFLLKKKKKASGTKGYEAVEFFYCRFFPEVVKKTEEGKIQRADVQ